MPIGSAYPDGLGISAVNWYGNGGGSDLSPDAQILVAEAIETAAGRSGYVPDQVVPDFPLAVSVSGKLTKTD